MKVCFDEIKEWPITTNKIKVVVDENAFFTEYAIISYYSTDNEFKNLAYEQLSDLPFLSVAGIRARWDTRQVPFVKFFVLAKKDNSYELLNSVRKYEKICSKIDCLDEYNQILKQRIIASLAINSLGKLKEGRMMYNNGSLLICDDKNFLIPQSRKELVCLKIEVNDYMILTVKTISFSNPKNIEELKRKKTCIFQVSKDIDGQWWSGQAVKPLVLRNMKAIRLDLETIYVKKKRFQDKHNLVPYWPYNPEDYTHGRLFALSQIIDSLNAQYNGLISIGFVDSKVLYYDEYRPSKDMLVFLTDYFSGKSVYIDNSYGESANNLIAQMKEQFQIVMQNSLVFHQKQTVEDLLIKLCEPKEENALETNYTKSLYRLAHSSTAIQHKVFYNNEKEDNFSISEARRILIELLVKDCLINRQIPQQLSTLIVDWEFFRYKICDDCVIGASLKAQTDGEINIKDFGFSYDKLPVLFEMFASDTLCYNEPEKIRGAKDYMVLKKNGNVYLIIDTDEIPILDVSLIDEAYDEIVNGGTPLSFFKRKKEAHKFLRGYIGLHLWKTEGLDGETEGAYAYISGTNSENMQIMKSTKMDRMPRVRKLFILHRENDAEVKTDIKQIMDMLRLGFGRWNEMMTYPFPFKFLQEYLDDACEIAFCKHWSEITKS